MKGKLFLWTGLVLLMTFACASAGFSQAQAVQNRIPQQIIIGGQRANGAYVAAPGGGMQSFTCPNPQQYVTVDSSSQGWACYDQATGVWLLNALPPAQAQAAPVPVPQQQPAIIYQQPPTIYQQPPTIIYQQPYPAVVYSAPAYPVIVEPAYPPSVVLGTAAIHAAGRIVSAAVIGGRYPRVYHLHPGRGRRW